MCRWTALLMFFLLSIQRPLTAVGADVQEYRTVTLRDGTTIRGVVLGGTATSMIIRGPRGVIDIPVTDIARVDRITREDYLSEEGLALVAFPVTGPETAADIIPLLDENLLIALRQRELLLFTPDRLSPSIQRALSQCDGPDCIAGVLHAEKLGALLPTLKARPRTGKEKAAWTLELQRIPAGDGPWGLAVLRFPSSRPPDEDDFARPLSALFAGTSASSPEAPGVEEDDASAGSDAKEPLVTPSPTPAASPESSPVASSGAPSPTSDEAAASSSMPLSETGEAISGLEGTGASAAGMHEESSTAGSGAHDKGNQSDDQIVSAAGNAGVEGKTPASEATEPVEIQEDLSAGTSGRPNGVSNQDRAFARRLNRLPIPGAASLVVYDRPGVALTQLGISLALTGAVVYALGDARIIGAREGLPVPWTYEHRHPNDALFLTGTGALSFALSSIAVNAAVEHFRTH